MNNSRKTLLPALFAVGTGLAAHPAAAIELGEITVQSTLGQPLRASIAYALGPNEQLNDYCVTLKPGHANNGLPAITAANVGVANGIISLTGKTALREPLMTVRVDVACPYTPNLSREYMLFIDPAAPIRAAVAAPGVAAPAAQPAARVAAPQAEPMQAARPPAARPTTAPRTPIDATARYRVQPGDSLSQIAARIENRPVGLWDAVARIFDANPDAFIDNDPNKLKAGSWLVMPDFAAVAADAPQFSTAGRAAAVAAPASVSAPDTVAEVSEPAPAPVDAIDDTAVLEPAAVPAVEDLRPGDVILDSEDSFVAADGGSADTSVVIPDTELEAPAPASSPNVPTATIVQPERPQPSATNWLLWLVGGGIVLLLGLLMFGRRNRDLGDPAAAAVEASHPLRRAADTGAVEALPDEDFDLSDDSPTEENLALDANLEIGTGLNAGTEVEVDHDFGYAGATDLDFEFPPENAGDTAETDMLPAPVSDPSSILEQEILPEDDDYDMSVIVDATKMPDPEAVTGRDLKAVAIEDNDGDDDDTDSYTVNQEIDYHILEQDYEDELTATQALNREIEKAAAELAERMENTDADDDTAGDLKLATVTSLDVTRQGTDGISELDDTGVNEELTEEMIADEKTAEMPAKGNEDTVDMPNKTKKA